MFKDFYTAYNYLENHLMFQDIYQSHFQECLDIEVVKVNPMNSTIEDDISKNTLTQVWLECGEYERDVKWHDINLDCGAYTFEEAIIKLAKLVYKYYNKGESNV